MGLDRHNAPPLDAPEFVLDLTAPSNPFGSAPSVSVVLTAHNDAASLPHVLPHIPEWVLEVIIADAGSTDATIEVARSFMPDVRVVGTLQDAGAALQSGLDAAAGDYIVCLGADGSGDPREIPAMIGALLAGADLAKGTRFRQGGSSAERPRHRTFATRALTQLVNRLFKTAYSDLCYDYFAIRRTVLPALIGSDTAIPSSHIDTVLNLRAPKSKLQVREVPSRELPQIQPSHALRTWRDGARILRVIVAERMS